MIQRIQWETNKNMFNLINMVENIDKIKNIDVYDMSFTALLNPPQPLFYFFSIFRWSSELCKIINKDQK